MNFYSIITMIAFLCVIFTHSTSKYKGVNFVKSSNKWRAFIYIERIFKQGGTFDDELDAAKRVNQMCDEFQIERKNPNIDASPIKAAMKPKKTMNLLSESKGVHYNKRFKRWVATIDLANKRYYGGCFDEEIEAVKKVNQLCDKLGIERKNPGFDSMPKQKVKYGEPTSQYKGVSWKKDRKYWTARIQSGKIYKYNHYDNELDAAKRVNQMCDEFGIPRKNPEIDAIPNLKENYKSLLNHHAMAEEFEGLMKILDDHNDPTAPIIKENLITAINDGEQTIMPEINFRAQNGESALSIAAKHGFSNVVKFLISKGAEKEHFTNENHTPLSLAVSQNHLKVVQVLFEDWISPNSHEKPYLHLSPLFNVKSREIAQLLIENDAVTHQTYNEKNQSPLTVACQNGYLDVVEFFLDDDLDVNHLDNDNKTPLFYALTNKHYDVVNVLISKGAKMDFTLKCYSKK